ncbi:HIT family protein [Aquimarina sp. RZ0]|uniref:HIT family protein n=1 Tax=Aquimarina sp. RZ0 TaxID=2607730 RepID=UPI0011F3C9ED|nr:HIT family protein [Aquimarina sp. RZ0]KAA1245173.1 HIT family protein [Aquimarina sp. RZ0]
MNNCIFCKIAKGEAKSWTVYEDEHTYAFFDIHPVSKYHTLVIPKKHYTNIFDIPEKELKAVMTTVKKVSKLYENKLGIRNIQIISNSGAEAQQEVFHLHFHIIPRKKGDGQHIRWNTYPQWTQDFDTMLLKIE